ncbi:hypothetical protein [Dyella tabacisoli]|uniref:DUF4340 domain-containing protein n=1 Tax=Dyella tabacisoli TaxID=2282381 RepID=A0A369URR4_9GAMM|nr:hypothetical protein [Dyella tabacisoli]RDD82428.1 hypothetical protein DVJ77_07780 [Dyella tabacisoli]
MKRATRTRLSLLLGVSALLALTGWQLQRDQQHAKETLLSIAPEAITQIELSLQGTPTEHYAKRDGHWWRTDGTPTRADEGRLGELTEIAAASVLSWRPLSDFDPAKIGLTKPLAVLSLDGQRLEFGEVSVTGPQRYVRVGTRVALVSMRYTPRPATGLRKKPDA